MPDQAKQRTLFPTKHEYPHEFWKECLRVNARVLLGYSCIYTYLSLNERHPTRCTYFRFAKTFLTLYVKVSVHILQGILLPTYSILNGIFAICSHFIHIHVHTFERQLHAIYIHTYLYIFWRTISCCTFIGKATFVLLIHILKGNFMPYVPILRSILEPHLTYMHICEAFDYLLNIHMYMLNDIFTPPRYKEIIMVHPEPSAGLKGKPCQHALTSMPSFISKIKGLGP